MEFDFTKNFVCLLQDMDETEEKFKKFELDDAKLINEMKIQNAKRKKFTAQVKNRLNIKKFSIF